MLLTATFHRLNRYSFAGFISLRYYDIFVEILFDTMLEKVVDAACLLLGWVADSCTTQKG